MSTNSGLPNAIRSILDIKFTAPDFVRGGKNSKEKNLSLDSILSKKYVLKLLVLKHI